MGLLASACEQEPITTLERDGEFSPLPRLEMRTTGIPVIGQTIELDLSTSFLPNGVERVVWFIESPGQSAELAETATLTAQLFLRRPGLHKIRPVLTDAAGLSGSIEEGFDVLGIPTDFDPNSTYLVADSPHGSPTQVVADVSSSTPPTAALGGLDFGGTLSVLTIDPVRNRLLYLDTDRDSAVVRAFECNNCEFVPGDESVWPPLEGPVLVTSPCGRATQSFLGGPDGRLYFACARTSGPGWSWLDESGEQVVPLSLRILSASSRSAQPPSFLVANIQGIRLLGIFHRNTKELLEIPFSKDRLRWPGGIARANADGFLVTVQGEDGNDLELWSIGLDGSVDVLGSYDPSVVELREAVLESDFDLVGISASYHSLVGRPVSDRLPQAVISFALNGGAKIRYESANEPSDAVFLYGLSAGALVTGP